jgi:hypothetical protein
LVAWLRQQIDEDELAWEMVAARDVVELLHGEPLAPRMLAEVKAKRAILDLHAENTEWTGTSGQSICSTCVTFDTNDYYEAHHETNFPCRTVLALAQPYAGRSGWREEWAT